MKTFMRCLLLSAVLLHHTEAQCQNGGYPSKTGCICPNLFYGPLCEFIKDNIPTIQSLESSVKVKLRVMNWNYTEGLADLTTEEYEKFETNFKAEMNRVYSEVPGFTEVNILALRPGSVIVDHEVIVKLNYSQHVPLTQRYQQISQKVVTELNVLKEQLCTSGVDALCIDGESMAISYVFPLTEDELCKAILPNGFKEFYTARVTSEGLDCVSRCDPRSPEYLKCPLEMCQLSSAGPECLMIACFQIIPSLNLSFTAIIVISVISVITIIGILVVLTMTLKKRCTRQDKTSLFYIKLI